MLRRISGVCGIASQVTGLISLLIAVSMSPWFSWTENYLSVLGVEGSAITLFNAGVILTGILSLVFAIGLWQSLLSGRLLGFLGMVSLVLGSLAFSGTGIFPRSTGMPHDSASLAFFLFISLAIFLIGIRVTTPSQKKVGSVESRGRCSHSCFSANSVAMGWRSYPTVTFCFAMVIVDNSL